MLGNMNQVMQLMQAMQNPQAYLQKMGLPQEALNSPQDAAQYLMQSGKINQGHIDQARMMYQQFMKK